MSENKSPFNAGSQRKLQRLATDLPAIWEELRGAGFHLFDLEVAHIEQMRERPPDEKPYADYFREVLKERIGFYRTSWLPECRAAQQHWVYRSAYLDHLQAKVDAGDYRFLGKHAENTRVILDPNFILYVALVGADTDRWVRFMAEYQTQKKREIENLRERIQSLSAPPCKPTPTRIARLLDEALVPLGFEMVLRDVKHGRFILRTILDQNVALYCEYSDQRGMVKGHMWPLRFVFQAPAAPLWEGVEVRTLPLRLHLGSFLPGDLWYLKHRGEWDAIVLGCLVNAKLLGLVAEKWKTY